MAGYELRGVTSYFASDQERNRAKTMLEALLKAIPEQSMRLQIRYEVVEDLGGLLDRYRTGKKTEEPEVTVLDEARIENWQRKETEGHYLRPLLHAYFIWDPRIHHQVTGKPIKQKLNLSLSAKSAIRRSEQEHRELLSEFESLLVGIEATMQAAELAPRRLTDDELFFEAKRALDPLEPDTRGHIPAEDFIEYRSARQQLVNVSILDETEFHLNVGGILHSFISLKELPDATFPGILRELAALDFPFVVNAQVTIPDQTKVLKTYKSRLNKDAGGPARQSRWIPDQRRSPGVAGSVAASAAGHHLEFRENGEVERSHRHANVEAGNHSH
ncbi:MAG TPA: hypothetical protein VKY85_01030 [Candidatus Angelobacter sp.]|nr:hypothetical protein [Candidatus Angelobacter sp.]